jgi:biotin carboxylase
VKKLLILSGGIEAAEAIKIAKKMGLYVIICDGNFNAPTRELADDFIHASIYHPDEIIKALAKYPHKDSIDGVITVAADNPFSVSAAAELLGLNSLSKETAVLSTNKIKMKDVLHKAGILLPWHEEINTLEQLIKIVESRPGEYVLKPIDSRGSRGVIRLNSTNQCKHALDYSISYSNSNQVILEEWITGDQLSSESIVINKNSFLCGLADRNYERLNELYPYVVEDGGETPSKYSNYEFENTVNKLMSKVCNAVNLTDGSIKGDLVLSGENLYLIEFAARLSGGYFSTLTIPLVYGYNLIENVIKIALNMDPILPAQPLTIKKYQTNRFCFLPEGKIKKISGFPFPNKNIIEFQLYVEEGDVIKKTTNHTLRAGTVLTVGSTPFESKELAENTINNLVFDIC